jgi:hypothetical protein
MAGDLMRSASAGSTSGTLDSAAKNSFRLPRFARSAKYSSVIRADIFSPTAELINWLTEIPSCSASPFGADLLAERPVDRGVTSASGRATRPGEIFA